MKKNLFFVFVIVLLTQVGLSQGFSIEQIAGFPFPSGLTATAQGSKLSWALDEQGRRNIYLAEGPDFLPEKLTAFDEDEGQEISSLQFSPDGRFLVFVRGGDHGGRNAHVPVNPLHRIIRPEVQVWAINLEQRKSRIISEGDRPVISRDNRIAFIKDGQVWSCVLEEDDPPKQLFETKGKMHSLEYSPSGEALLFVSQRGNHSFIGFYRQGHKRIRWIAPAFHFDHSPRWSPDGRKIAFVRTPGGGGSAHPLLEQRHAPWEIRVADIRTLTSYRRWKAPETLAGSLPSVDGGVNLHWGEGGQLVYLSYHEGWPNLYSMDAAGGTSRLLTPGEYHVEHVAFSPDKKQVLFSANSGEEEADKDRRHIGRIQLSEAKLTWETSGNGIEAFPVFLAGRDFAYLSATSKRPLLPTINNGKGEKVLSQELIPEDFPLHQLVEPQQVSFVAPDGVKVYGQLFEPSNGTSKRPAVVFVHGGPQRQMLLGWSYMDYYANTYAINQYLAGKGFSVLSVNYRLGIGYGYEFHRPGGTYFKGAAEYQDIKAAGEFLASLPQIDKEQIGIYGGSYGGYLTALALGRDPELFKTGVDLHGVHEFEGRYPIAEGYEVAPDIEQAKRIAWESSPLAYLDSWKAPVLFIHGDDDRNVGVSHTIDLIRRFEEKKLPFEFLMIPGETHHWMVFSNRLQVDKATVEFLERHLME